MFGVRHLDCGVWRRDFEFLAFRSHVQKVLKMEQVQGQIWKVSRTAECLQAPNVPGEADVKETTNEEALLHLLLTQQVTELLVEPFIGRG